MQNLRFLSDDRGAVMEVIHCGVSVFGEDTGTRGVHNTKGDVTD